MNSRHNQSQSGFVAIFTVVFFIILISVITLGFVRIMIDERRQSTDNDLTASALNAAETGVEDGKRLLLYCEQNPTEPACTTALSQEQCPGVFDDISMATLMGVNQESDKSIRVAGTAGHEQHYTCLLIKKITDDYKGTLQANQSDVVPLKATDEFDTIEISWHLIAEEGSPTSYPTIGSLHNTNDWISGQYPAYMRAQYIEHDNGGINLTDLDESSRHVFLAPATGASALTSVDLNAVDLRPAGNSSPGARAKDQAVPVQCVPVVGPATQPYACTIRIELGTDVDPSSATSYLRLVPLYGSTNFRVKLFDGSELVNFNGVQPIIDSTGRSNDVFRRIQARVRMDGAAFYPQFALESGKDLCKDMVVTSDIASFADNCHPLPPPPPPPPEDCTAVISTHIDDITVVGGEAKLIPLAASLKQGCKYQFAYGWGDYHPAQQAACEGGPSHPGWYPGVCGTWKQPYESMFMEFLASGAGPVVSFEDEDGDTLDKTPDTGDIPNRFPLPDPDVYMNPLGKQGAEAKRLYVTVDLTNSSSDVTHIMLKHSIQPPQSGFGGSAHLYDFSFTPIP